MVLGIAYRKMLLLEGSPKPCVSSISSSRDSAVIYAVPKNYAYRPSQPGLPTGYNELLFVIGSLCR